MDKPVKAQRTRDDIVQASMRLFSLHGYHRTSTADILAAVSVSKGAFYYHFRSKEDLAQTILTQMRQDYQHKLLEPIMALEQTARRPAAMLDQIVQLNKSSSWFNCLLLARLGMEFAQQDSPPAQQIAEILDWLKNIWQGLLSDAQSAGTVRTDLDCRELAQLITAALSGAIINRELEGDSEALTQIAEQIKLLISS